MKFLFSDLYSFRGTLGALLAVGPAAPQRRSPSRPAAALHPGFQVKRTYHAKPYNRITRLKIK